MTAVSFDRYETVWLKEAENAAVVGRPEDDDEKCPLDECPLCAANSGNGSDEAHEFGGDRPYGPNGYLPHVNEDVGSASNTSSPPTVPLCVLGEVQLRFLCPDDLEEVRALCQDWFPIGEFFQRLAYIHYNLLKCRNTYVYHILMLLQIILTRGMKT